MACLEISGYSGNITCSPEGSGKYRFNVTALEEYNGQKAKCVAYYDEGIPPFASSEQDLTVYRK